MSELARQKEPLEEHIERFHARAAPPTLRGSVAHDLRERMDRLHGRGGG